MIENQYEIYDNISYFIKRSKYNKNKILKNNNYKIVIIENYESRLYCGYLNLIYLDDIGINEYKSIEKAEKSIKEGIHNSKEYPNISLPKIIILRKIKWKN